MRDFHFFLHCVHANGDLWSGLLLVNLDVARILGIFASEVMFSEEYVCVINGILLDMSFLCRDIPCTCI